jgi:hypothetical protein
VAETVRNCHRVTVSALVSILERVTSGGGKLSLAENMLFIACEIWAAAGRGTLSDLLGREPADPLRAASTVFVAMGALQTATMLRHAADTAAVASTARERRRSLQQLGERLCSSTEPVDLLIARYAASLVPAPARRARAGGAPAAAHARTVARRVVLH